MGRYKSSAESPARCVQLLSGPEVVKHNCFFYLNGQWVEEEEDLEIGRSFSAPCVFVEQRLKSPIFDQEMFRHLKAKHTIFQFPL